MNKDIKEIANKYGINPKKYTIKNSSFIVSDDDKSFVIKKKNRDGVGANINDIYKYLRSRSFEYYPALLSAEHDDYDIFEYIEEIETPKEQKALDIVYLISLLHNKTTHYKDVTEDYAKEIYESVNQNVDYLFNYYTDVITIAEKSVYMSPSEYLIARNISKIYSCLGFCKREIESWYKKSSVTNKQRYTLNHNNLELDHLIRNNNPYLISWGKSKMEIPIYDFLQFYKNHYLEQDFRELLKVYEEKYPLKQEERQMLFILISMPPVMSYKDNEYDRCREVSNILDYIYKSETLIKPYYEK